MVADLVGVCGGEAGRAGCVGCCCQRAVGGWDRRSVSLEQLHDGADVC